MTLITTARHRVLQVHPGEGGRWTASSVTLPPGVYEVERVPNPLAPGQRDWICLKGRLIGQSVDGWQRFEGPKGSVTFEEGRMGEEFKHPVIEHHRKMLGAMGRDWVQDVRAFMMASGQEVKPTPGVADKDIWALRETLVDEEYDELLDAMDAGDLPGIADACADLIYVTIGTALAYGIDLRDVWAAVHESNLKKAGGLVREDGKRLKPEGWVHPDIAAILAKQNPLVRS